LKTIDSTKHKTSVLLPEITTVKTPFYLLKIIMAIIFAFS